jgi:hypothetical protein
LADERVLANRAQDTGRKRRLHYGLSKTGRVTSTHRTIDAGAARAERCW